MIEVDKDLLTEVINKMDALITRYEGAAMEAGLDEWTISLVLKPPQETLNRLIQEVSK